MPKHDEQDEEEIETSKVPAKGKGNSLIFDHSGS
jgi:hypothetical protein